MTDSFEVLAKQVKEHLTNEGFTCLYGTLGFEADVVWVSCRDWKEFLSTAKSQGVNLIVLSQETVPLAYPDRN